MRKSNIVRRFCEEQGIRVVEIPASDTGNVASYAGFGCGNDPADGCGGQGLPRALTVRPEAVLAAQAAWPADTLWIVDRLGYLYCVGCAREIWSTGEAVRRGAPSFGSDRCDRCGKEVGESVNGEIVA